MRKGPLRAGLLHYAPVMIGGDYSAATFTSSNLR